MLRLPSFHGDQPVEIITVRTVGAESLFIEKALDAATQANLVRVLLIAHGPAHFTVPAAAKYQDRCSSHSSCHQTEGNLPTRLLFFSHQNPATNRQPTGMILAVFPALDQQKPARMADLYQRETLRLRLIPCNVQLRISPRRRLLVKAMRWRKARG